MRTKTNKKEELNLLNRGNMVAIKKAIEEFAFNQDTQILLIKEKKLRHILELYLSIRKLGKQAITVLLSTPRGKYKIELIKDAIIGNSLSEHNEELLIENYPELVEPYLKANPNGNYFCSEAVEGKAKEIGLEDLVKRYPRPVFNKPAAQSLGGLFSPEMLAKLGV